VKIEEVNENTKDLVPILIYRLEQSSEVIEDLVQVFDIIDKKYDQDKAYTEGVFGKDKSELIGNSLGNVVSTQGASLAKQK